VQVIVYLEEFWNSCRTFDEGMGISYILRNSGVDDLEEIKKKETNLKLETPHSSSQSSDRGKKF